MALWHVDCEYYVVRKDYLMQFINNLSEYFPLYSSCFLVVGNDNESLALSSRYSCSSLTITTEQQAFHSFLHTYHTYSYKHTLLITKQLSRTKSTFWTSHLLNETKWIRNSQGQTMKETKCDHCSLIHPSKLHFHFILHSYLPLLSQKSVSSSLLICFFSLSPRSLYKKQSNFKYLHQPPEYIFSWWLDKVDIDTFFPNSTHHHHQHRHISKLVYFFYIRVKNKDSLVVSSSSHPIFIL